MTNSTMTKKEMFAYIAEHMAEDELVVAFCEKEITALDTKAAKAKERAATKREAGDELRERVAALLTDDYQSVADITAALDDEEVSTNKVVYRLNALVNAGVAVKADAKVAADEGGKSRVIKVFKLADNA